VGTDALDLCVEALGAGTAHGVWPYAAPDEAAARLGGDFAENKNRTVMWRDFGLVECHYERSRADRPWRGIFLMVQAHRLDVPVSFDAVATQLHQYGQELVEESYVDPAYRCFGAPVSGASVIIADPAGDIEKIAVPAWPMPRWPSVPRPQWTSARERLKRLLTLPVDRRSVSDDRLAGLFGPLEALIGTQPERAHDWFTLGLWLFDRAVAAALWPAEEATLHWVSFAGRHLELADAQAQLGIAQRCRQLSPRGVDPLERDWRELSPDELRRRRLAQHLRLIEQNVA
jgi:hypothetical protein